MTNLSTILSFVATVVVAFTFINMTNAANLRSAENIVINVDDNTINDKSHLVDLGGSLSSDADSSESFDGEHFGGSESVDTDASKNTDYGRVLVEINDVVSTLAESSKSKKTDDGSGSRSDEPSIVESADSASADTDAETRNSSHVLTEPKGKNEDNGSEGMGDARLLLEADCIESAEQKGSDNSESSESYDGDREIDDSARRENDRSAEKNQDSDSFEGSDSSSM